MTGATCPKCNGSGRVLSHIHTRDVHNVGAGMGMHRCDRCGGQGVVHGGLGSGGGSGGGNLAYQFRRLVIWMFAIPLAFGFGSEPPFGLNWALSALIGGTLGAGLALALLSFRIGRYILWALLLGFFGSAIIAGIMKAG